MTSKARILFYSESAIAGGHEKMALSAHQAIQEHTEGTCIHWLINEKNTRLATDLRSASISFETLRFERQFNWLRPSPILIKQVILSRRTLRRLDPDLVVILQGGIMGSYGGVLAARLAGVDFCSYIAMAHRSTELATYRFPRLWNSMRSVLFKLIPRYITIDRNQAERISREHPRAQISIVENYVPAPPARMYSKADAKVRLGVPIDRSLIGVIGRFEFSQKAQDWLIQSLSTDDFLQDKTIIFVGGGPDRQSLEGLVQSSKWRLNMRVFEWRSEMDDIYDALDLLLIPSRAEGVPLVMLEALTRHIPVVGSERDGMKDWLPRQWRFSFGDYTAMKNAVTHALGNSDQADWEQINSRLCDVTSARRFASEFAAALHRCCK